MSEGAKRGLSIGTKLSLGALILVSVAALLATFVLTQREYDRLLDAEERAGAMVTDMVVGAALAPLEFEDTEVMAEDLARLNSNPAVNYAAAWRVHDERLDRLAEYRARGFEAEIEAPPPSKYDAAGVVEKTSDELVFNKSVHSGDGSLIGVVELRLNLERPKEAYAASQRLILMSSGGVALAMLGLLFGLVRVTVVRPLAALVGAAQRVEQGERGQVDVYAHDEAGRLAQAFNRMGEAIAEREQRIAAANRQLQRLLDNMRQAIFSFGPDLNIRGNHSRATLDIFRRGHVEGLGVVEELLRGHDEESHEAEAVRVWFDMVFELGADLWGEALELAPKELTLRPDTEDSIELELSFRPVIEEGELVEIIVLATDTTERNEIERQRQEWESKYAREMGAMQKIVSGGTQMFVQFLRNSEERLERIRQLLDTQDTLRRGQLDELFRHAHTIKGEARTFELLDLHRAATRLEDLLSRLRRWMEEERAIDWATMLSEARQLHEEVQGAFEGTRDLLVEASPLGHAILDQTTVFRGDLDQLLALVREDGRAGDWPSLREVVARLGSRPFAELAMRLVEAVPTWAEEEGKRARVEIYGGETRVPADLVDVLPSALNHLVRNAVAHGIEVPAERAAAGKAEVGVIALRCKALDGGVELTVEDDGQGLDAEAVMRRAKARGVGSTGVAPTKLIFVPGLSTKSSASDLSGRGVGLQAVRNELGAVGYAVAVESSPGAGMRFTLSPGERRS